MPSQSLSSTLEGVKEVPSGELVIRAVHVGECLAFSLVVPTLNESRNLEELVDLLVASGEVAHAPELNAAWETLLNSWARRPLGVETKKQ